MMPLFGEEHLINPGDAEDIVCPICHEIFKDPVFAPTSCQDVFCRQCIEGCLEASDECPTCCVKLKGEELRTALHAIRYIDKVDIKCPRGCIWKGRSDRLRGHFEDGCPREELATLEQDLEAVKLELKANDKEMRELQDERSRLIQEQESLERRRREILEALDRGEMPAAVEDSGKRVPRQDTGSRALKKQVADLQQAIELQRDESEVGMSKLRAQLAARNDQEPELQALRSKITQLEQAVEAERTQRQAGASETQRVQQELANLQRQDEARQRRVAELEKALEAECARHRAPAPAFQPAGRQPQVAPPNRYTILSQAEQERKHEQLKKAATYGKVSEVSRLLNEGLVDVNGQNDYGFTALHWASINGHVDVVERLLQAGADVNRAKTDGQTPLHLAGADVNRARDDGWTPLYVASAAGRIYVVEGLLQARANPNQADNRGQTPLSVACAWGGSAGKPEIERLLRQAGGR